ncbi:MAG TPA: hypothetical protein VGM79_30475 [Streptosporangiaceae bacterium]
MPATGASPRIPASWLARCPRASQPPAGHTAAELAALLLLLRAARATSIAIGHGRHPASAAAARALADAWTGATQTVPDAARNGATVPGAGRTGGTVLDVVGYPADAASWLRPARRLARAQPDAWVIADNPAGCAQLARRLAGQPGWAAARTFGFAGAATADLIPLAGPGLLDGMTGATPDGGTWRIEDGQLTRPGAGRGRAGPAA